MLDARRLPFECFYPWSAFVNPPDSDRTYLSRRDPFSLFFLLSIAVCSLLALPYRKTGDFNNLRVFFFRRIVVARLTFYCDAFR